MDSCEITKRQTNTDNKTDYVWIQVNASNSSFSYTADYKLTYVLYNDGWQLDDFEEEQHSVMPKYYPSEDDAASALEQYYDGCILVESNIYQKNSLGQNIATFQFERQEETEYLVTDYGITLTYYFSPSEGWHEKISVEDRGHRPNLIGKWIYEDDTHSYIVDILSCEGNTLVLDYDLKKIETKYYSLDYHVDTTHEVSESPVTVTLTEDTPGYANARIRYYASGVFSRFGSLWVYLEDVPYLSIDGCHLIKR